MAPSASFNPPPADGPGKVHIDNWVPPPVTKQVDNFAQLSTIDLSLMDSDDPAVVSRLEQQIKTAIREDGFLFLENYGVDIDQVGTRSMAKILADKVATSTIWYRSVLA
jgi:hypothetical protein